MTATIETRVSAGPMSAEQPPAIADDRRSLDPVSLVAGVGLIALGVLLLLDQEGALELSAGWLGAIVCAIGGLSLLISGLRDEARAPAKRSYAGGDQGGA